jgi:VIT1/CCC1 family predicted Fe2+/Mn2+ transporter
MNEPGARIAMRAQQVEITESVIYERLADAARDPKNAKVLRSIAGEEKRHAAIWRKAAGAEAKPARLKVFWVVLLARTFGLTFVLKRMERKEGTGSRYYDGLAAEFPQARKLGQEESRHEKALLNMLDEELLQYVGSIVLGLNDALVELTGALAGFTLALGNTRIISLAGLITGISAAFSMAASDYLSTKAEGDPRAAKSAVYTGVAYLLTVMVLILPFLLLSNKFLCLGITLAVVIAIIGLFNYYLSVAKDVDFKRRFLEMGAISLGVAAFSFLIGFLLKKLLGIDA